MRLPGPRRPPGAITGSLGGVHRRLRAVLGHPARFPHGPGGEPAHRWAGSPGRRIDIMLIIGGTGEWWHGTRRHPQRHLQRNLQRSHSRARSRAHRTTPRSAFVARPVLRRGPVRGASRPAHRPITAGGARTTTAEAVTWSTWWFEPPRVLVSRLTPNRVSEHRRVADVTFTRPDRVIAQVSGRASPAPHIDGVNVTLIDGCEDHRTRTRVTVTSRRTGLVT